MEKRNPKVEVNKGSVLGNSETTRIVDVDAALTDASSTLFGGKAVSDHI